MTRAPTTEGVIRAALERVRILNAVQVVDFCRNATHASFNVVRRDKEGFTRNSTHIDGQWGGIVRGATKGRRDVG